MFQKKNHKCPKCFKIISENLIKNTGLENEFKNTYIKCKYTGCKESVNLYEYEEHLKVCPFKNIKDSLEIDNLVYFDSLPFNQDPYSNSVLMNYSVKKAENDINLNYDSSYVNYYENIEKIILIYSMVKVIWLKLRFLKISLKMINYQMMILMLQKPGKMKLMIQSKSYKIKLI